MLTYFHFKVYCIEKVVWYRFKDPMLEWTVQSDGTFLFTCLQDSCVSLEMEVQTRGVADSEPTTEEGCVSGDSVLITELGNYMNVAEIAVVGRNGGKRLLHHFYLLFFFIFLLVVICIVTQIGGLIENGISVFLIFFMAFCIKNQKIQLTKMLLLIAKTKTNGVPHGPRWDTAPCGTFNSIVNSPATSVSKGRSSCSTVYFSILFVSIFNIVKCYSQNLDILFLTS